MPLYVWRCLKCEKKTEIVRSFDDYLDPPNTEEGGECNEDKHEWDKEITPTRWLRGRGWQGQKGSWIYLIGVFGEFFRQVCGGVV